jgi:integrase
MGERRVGTADEFDQALVNLNKKLRAGKTRVRVEQRGDRLSLVACLPNRAGKDKRTRRISPGLSANLLGITEINRLALRLAGELAAKRFDWKDWTDEPDTPQTEKTCGQLAELYKIHLGCSGTLKGDDVQRDRHWRKNFWNPALKWLPQNRSLDESALIIAAVHHDAVDEQGRPRRSRQHACMRLEQFAKWAGLQVSLKQYRGKYSPSQIVRNIPEDGAIEAAVLGMANADWRWAAGMMAAFGLRDHEVWFAKLDHEMGGWVTRVSEGKTGPRTIRPLHPHWIELFDLPNGKAPVIKVRTHDEYGERMARQFKRCGIPFTPYDTRHAYAIRSSVAYKIPISVSAAHMGHSPEVHLRTYNKHLSEAAKVLAYQEAIASHP